MINGKFDFDEFGIIDVYALDSITPHGELWCKDLFDHALGLSIGARECPLWPI